MISQVVTRFIILSDMPGYYWGRGIGSDTTDLTKARFFTEKPTPEEYPGLQPSRVRMVRVDIREMPWEVTE